MKKGPNWGQKAEIEAEFKAEAESEKCAAEVPNRKSITKQSIY